MKDLDQIAKSSLYTVKTGVLMQDYTFGLIKRFFHKDKSVLELGPAEGVMTKYFVEYFKSVDVLEGSKIFCEQLQERFDNINVYNDYFEEFKSAKKYDLIVLGHVLEHVDDPVLVLNNVREMLSDDGRIFCAVPNANSLHRQAAVIMNLLEKETSMSEKDYHHGHKRVFTAMTFKEQFNLSKLKIEHFGGYWIKPLSDAQLEDWSEDALNAFMKLGELYPDIAAENYIIASK
ncbi:hypothetical protein SE23_17235 [Vibrio sinaloensis]|uniref:class I SAM-dependent methyltransferase n=1 Tax=Photobacterium sp. (strain ATCC 43367) TaxID=379097 RepID=UPI00057D8C5F|nr:class I SAM-dependent methyltransferase [Vibrio sinaloensis]KIE19461.1 hypothetical protein SE23_17235 [Vibrio sinaloensis]